MKQTLKDWFYSLNEEIFFYTKVFFIRMEQSGEQRLPVKIKGVMQIIIRGIFHRKQKEKLPLIGSVNPNRLTGLKKPLRYSTNLMEYDVIFFDGKKMQDNPFWDFQKMVCRINQVKVIDFARKKIKQQQKEKMCCLITSDFKKYKGYRHKLDVFFYHDPVWVFQKYFSYMSAGKGQINASGENSLSKEYKRIYEKMMGQEIFSGKSCHGLLYTHSLLCIAPLVYHFLEEIDRQQRKNGKVVVFLCEKEDIIVRLYKSLFGFCENFEWTALAAFHPGDPEEWRKVKLDMPYLENVPIDRLKHACYRHAICEEAVQHYVGYIPKEKNYIFVNPYGGGMTCNLLVKYLLAQGYSGEYTTINFAQWTGEKLSGNMIGYLRGDRTVLAGIGKESFHYAVPEDTPGWQNRIVCETIEKYSFLYREEAGKNKDIEFGKADRKRLLIMSAPIWEIIKKEEAL